MITIIRQALPQELGWINQQYDLVQFQHSDFQNEYIAIAEAEGQKAGIGRLISVSESEVELGGMYVPEAYRGKGIARQLVSHLLVQATGKTVYCLPFEHLQDFYRSFGFAPANPAKALPCQVAAKLGWCNQTYSQNTLLLTLQP